MKITLRSITLGLLLAFASLAHAVLPLPSNLTNFDNPDGQHYLKRSADNNTVKLISNFVTQNTTTYCGVASLVMVLNSSGLQAPLDTEHYNPDKPDDKFLYFNQKDFFTEAVTGIISQKEVADDGITLLQLSRIADTFGLATELHYADSLRTKGHFLRALKQAISNQQFVILNFFRKDMGQVGGGHHSPVAAYDKGSDSFLILDVARYKYPSYWVTAEDLWKAAHTKDGDTYRGFIAMHPKSISLTPALKNPRP